MALINCPECRKQVSDSALSCPHCGYVLTQQVNDEPIKYAQPKKKDISTIRWVIIAIVVFLTIVALKNCGGDSDASSRRSNGSSTSTNSSTNTSKEWYHGGTLHKAKI